MPEDGSQNGRVARVPTTRGFRDLRVWDAGIALVRTVYLLTRGFPREEVYGLTGQMRRAAISIPSNIAEGQAGEHLREYLHHLSMAQGSLGELETQIEIAIQLEFLAPADGDRLINEASNVARQLRALRVALEQRAALADRSSNPRNLKPDRNPCLRT